MTPNLYTKTSVRGIVQNIDIGFSTSLIRKVEGKIENFIQNIHESVYSVFCVFQFLLKKKQKDKHLHTHTHTHTPTCEPRAINKEKEENNYFDLEWS